MNKKVLLTIGALVPFLYTLGIFIYQFSLIFSISSNMSEAQLMDRMSTQMGVIYMSSIVLMVLMVVLKTYFVKHALTNAELTGSGPMIWMVVLLIFSTIPMFIYMFKYIYNKPWKEQLSFANHKTGSKVMWTGIVVIIPYVFVIAVMIFASTMFGNMMKLSDPNGANFMAVLAPMLISEMLMMIAMLVSLIVFIYLAAKNEKFTSGERAVWIVMLILQNVMTAAIYWFIYEFQEEPRMPDQVVENNTLEESIESVLNQ